MKVAIVGGGIGGLTTAIALTRRGVEAEVYEQAPEVAPVGASLSIGPNALRLMDELGVLAGLREVGVTPDAVELLRWDDGSLLLHTEMGPAMERRFGAPQLDFFRPDLHRVLLAALPDGTMRLGAQADRVEQDEGGASITFVDGRQLEADVVVAADGIRSTIRPLLAGADAPVFSGTVVYRGVARMADLPHLHDRVNRYWLGPERHGVSYMIASGDLLAVNCAVRRAKWSRESWTLEAPVAEALAHFDGWDEALLERIRACGTFLRGAVFVRRALEHWAYGRVALLGDAAHAMEPFHAQGAAQAIEDAYVLAECLATAEHDPAAGLRRYERLRMSRAEELQASSHEAAEVFYLPDGEAQRRRDAGYATLHSTLPWGPRQPIWEHDVRDALARLA